MTKSNKLQILGYIENAQKLVDTLDSNILSIASRFNPSKTFFKIHDNILHHIEQLELYLSILELELNKKEKNNE